LVRNGLGLMSGKAASVRSVREALSMLHQNKLPPLGGVLFWSRIVRMNQLFSYTYT
jgi:hypothetical protein